MKKITIVLIVCVCLAVSACGGKVSYQEYVQKLCNLDISGSSAVSDEDTHGGFLGDGARMVQFDCTEISESVLPQVKDWKELPLTGNLQLMMYGGSKNGVSYAYHLAEKYGIPEITKGCYFFLDRHSKATDPQSDMELFDRSSFNFSLVLYDCDTAKLYLFEFDT